MPIDQHETITSVRSRWKGRGTHSLLVRLVGLHPRVLVGEVIRYQRLQITRVLVPRQQDAGVGFNLLEIGHPQVIPGFCVRTVKLDRLRVRGDCQARLACSPIGCAKAELSLSF